MMATKDYGKTHPHFPKPACTHRIFAEWIPLYGTSPARHASAAFRPSADRVAPRASSAIRPPYAWGRLVALLLLVGRPTPGADWWRCCCWSAALRLGPIGGAVAAGRPPYAWGRLVALLLLVGRPTPGADWWRCCCWSAALRLGPIGGAVTAGRPPYAWGRLVALLLLVGRPTPGADWWRCCCWSAALRLGPIGGAVAVAFPCGPSLPEDLHFSSRQSPGASEFCCAARRFGVPIGSTAGTVALRLWRLLGSTRGLLVLVDSCLRPTLVAPPGVYQGAADFLRLARNCRAGRQLR
ncbi:uncharacterized protein LOC129760348 [Uranotaenia lowii]|uniref:uncharacterized protein LOC129760348 n=1 Tax=Uranotaenia lowii TaxID=190385 RepID=UPI002479F776|nr:uncharacterized protein LOC129760348 [Uranotaenia lowii]